MKNTEVIDTIFNHTDINVSNENANMDAYSPQGKLQQLSSYILKQETLKMINPYHAKLHEDGFIHIHDLDYYLTGTTTCTQIDLTSVLKDGFRVGNCFMREPQSIRVAAEHVAIIFQANQNFQHGGQAIPSIDYMLAPYVEKTFDKYMKKGYLSSAAMKCTIDDTFEAMEGLVHNLNAMKSRGGNQVPFTSINFGLDTSKFGRVVTEQLLKAQEQGLGDNSTPIFPILVFKVKEGINYNPEDTNYDLFLKAIECTSKRLFPNFMFMDTEFNSATFDINDPNTHPATMGCRTRVYDNINGENTTNGRGNLSFTSLNLPMIVAELLDDNARKGSEKQLMKKIERYADEVCEQLYLRYLYQRSIPKEEFNFLYDSGSWKWTEDNTRLDAGTLAVGFIGLAEALKLFTGKHHGECEESQQLGIRIIERIKAMTDYHSKAYNLNFGVIATPAEGLAGTALRKFISKHGVLEGVSDRQFFTNSNHVPVYYNIPIHKKIEIEAQYHNLTRGGHICYVEVDGAATKNKSAMMDIIKKMKESGIGYGSINHPIDRCRDCEYMAIIDDECPKCNSSNISRIRRITGYLVGDMDKWNSAKKEEESKRVKHGKR